MIFLKLLITYCLNKITFSHLSMRILVNWVQFQIVPYLLDFV